MSPKKKQREPVDISSLGAGDSYLVTDLLPPELHADAFQKLREETAWNVMKHRGGEVPRLVAVQGEFSEDGGEPIYRHPADQSPPLNPFTPTVSLIRAEVQRKIGHPVNHVLIQHYRSGADFISEHSDKTIDVVRDSTIVNVSLGAQRNMILKTKKDQVSEESPERKTQCFPLEDNSMFVMGMETNKRWMHAINHDNRPMKTKSEKEQAYGGERISLTFRHIGTFLSADHKKIYGQGATAKDKLSARDVVQSGIEGDELIIAFGRENHDSDFDWDLHYGQGSDVLHFKTPGEDDAVENKST